LLVLAAVYLEALAASLALHHWPIPSLDDPKSIPTAPLHLLNTPLVFGLFPVALVTFAIAVANWRMFLCSSFYRSWLSINVLGIVLHLVLAYTDPGQVWNWWLD
jgi:hypothetical protein